MNYWGLDYPPLTAYHSYFFGKMWVLIVICRNINFRAQMINKKWVDLHTSKGHESQEHKLFMRLSVILTMLILYAPAIYDIHQYWYSERKNKRVSQNYIKLY